MSNALRSTNDRQHTDAKSTLTRCPTCNEPIEGITTNSPSSHRFIPCEHDASEELLTSPDGSTPLINLIAPNPPTESE